MTARDPVPMAHLLRYALPWFAVQLCFLPVMNLVTGYYADSLGVSLVAISSILLFGRLLDAVTDPLIGTLSDRTPARFGRRRVWVMAGLPVLMAGAWLLFVPPETAGALYLFLTMSLTFLGFTMVQVPYVAWGAELSGHYDERNRVVAWRETLGVVGTLTAVATPVIAQSLGYPGLGPALFGLAVGVVILLPLLMTPALLSLPDQPSVETDAPPPSFFEGLKIVAGNRYFVLLQLAVIAAFIGVAPGGALSFLMIKYTFGAEALFGPMILGEFAMMLLFIPFWAWLAGKIGKHRAVAIGFLWMAIFTSPIPLLTAVDPLWVLVFNTIRGIGFGAAFVVVYSLAADVIDVDTLKTGQQRSGIYMALGGFFLKLAMMGGAAFALAWPTFFGFDQNDPEPTGAIHLAIAYSWISCFFWIISVPLFWFFPLDRKRQEEIRAALAAGPGGAATKAPAPH